MILNLISKDTVKTQLGITSNIYDDEITTMLPIVSSDIRRILNQKYDKQCTASFESGDTDISFTANFYYQGFVKNYGFNLGQVLYHPNLPEDTYLESYDPDTDIYTLSETPTGDGSYIYPHVTIDMWPAMSKMIFYKIGKQSTSSADVEKLNSISYGSVSKSFSDKEINSKYDYPQTLIDDLGTPNAKVG